MEAAPSAEAIVRHLEGQLTAGPDAFRTAVAQLYADKVELRHEPPLSLDGIVDGKRLAESSKHEAAAITGVLSDLRYADTQVSLDGDCVTIAMNLLGTVPTGASVRLPIRMQCRIEDGRIVAVTQAMGQDAMQAWAQVAAAAGITGASNLLDSSGSTTEPHSSVF
jgi:ketosteroid isomerase-like protein